MQTCVPQVKSDCSPPCRTFSPGRLKPAPLPSRDDRGGDVSTLATVDDDASKAAGDPAAGVPGRNLLAVTSAIAAEIRAALMAEVGLRRASFSNIFILFHALRRQFDSAVTMHELWCRCSAGVAHNKLLAKLVAGLHKPDAQTSLPSCFASAFVAPLPVRALRGVGHRTEVALAAAGVGTVLQLRHMPPAQLCAAVGDKLASVLAEASRGQSSQQP